jgi:PAS domain S-box-containing protein
MLKRVSLITKMLALTLIVGAVTWGILDRIQTRSIGGIFRDQMADELALQAQSDRLAFDNFVKTQAQAVKLFVSQKRFNDYLDKAEAAGWASGNMPPKTYKRRPPPWFPRMSVARAFMQARYAFLLGPHGNVREVYQAGVAAPPVELLKPTALLRELSHNQSYMTDVGGVPYIIASEYVSARDGRVRATLVLATPLDDETLFSTHGMTQKDRITALLSGRDPVVIASSRPDLIPDGTRLSDLSEDFLIAGKSFFDYGSSDLRLQFSSFITKDEMKKLTGRVLEKERSQRAITALALVVAFACIMFWITGNIKVLTGRVSGFSTNVLGIKRKGGTGGDELMVLKDEFDTLTDEVITARAALQKEAEDRILLERKAAEAKLRERDIHILMRVMEMLGVGVVAIDDSGLSAVNPVMERFALDCGGIDRFNPGYDGGNDELTINDCHGETRHFKIGRFHSPETGKSYLLVHDVTETRRFEQTLMESEGRARAITETATDAIILIDDTGRITYWNPAAEKIFGYGREDAMGQDVHDLLTPEQYLPAAKSGFEHFRQTGEGPALGISRRLTALKRDGSEFPVELSLSAFQQKGKWVSVGVVRDITERVKAEEDKSALFHMMTHDIKGPLSIIYGYGELLNSQSKDPETLEMVHEMQHATSRISSLIDDMLALSRLETGKTVINFEPVSLRSLIEQAVLDCEAGARDMDVEFEVEADGLPGDIQADKTQLGRAIGNLAANAVNYNRHGGRVVIRTGMADADKVFIEVSDTGVGIPPEDIPHVFDKYFRSKTTSKRRGTGLGLAIVKAALDAHGGTVSVKSRPGEGSTFRIELPMRQETSK